MLIPRQIFELVGITKTGPGSRYAVKGVLFERDSQTKEPVAVATDGKFLGVVRWPEPPVEDFPEIDGLSKTQKAGFKVVLPQESCKEAPKLAPKSPHLSMLTHVVLDETTPSENRTKLAGTDLDAVRRLEPRPIDGTFPDWRAVQPNFQPGETVEVHLDAGRLATILQTMQRVVPDRDRDCDRIILRVPIKPTRTTEKGKEQSLPVEIEAKSPYQGIRMTAILMPLEKV